jgi:hypothetical protein
MGKSLFPGQEALLDVLGHCGVCEATKVALLSEDFDLESFMVCLSSDFVALGIAPHEAEALSKWIRGASM